MKCETIQESITQYTIKSSNEKIADLYYILTGKQTNGLSRTDTENQIHTILKSKTDSDLMNILTLPSKELLTLDILETLNNDPKTQEKIKDFLSKIERRHNRYMMQCAGLIIMMVGFGIGLPIISESKETINIYRFMLAGGMLGTAVSYYINNTFQTKVGRFKRIRQKKQLSNQGI